MPTSGTCANCGALLAVDARTGFCSKCLLTQAQAGLFGFNTEEDFGDYELLEEIGRGGMGVVYQARQRSLDRVVAIKRMVFGPGSNPELVKRFRAEAVAAAALQHPNIVAIHEVGVHEGQHFFVMDYVQGQSLAHRVTAGPLPTRRAAGYLKTLAEAVHYAHERGILHRDLKPSNVLIDEQDQPRIVDFGLARRLEGASELTVTGQVLGSPHYLPPEQATAQRGRVSRRTDVYGLGATLYHLLTGRPPFQAESLAQTLDLVLHTDPIAPHLLNPTVPRDLETICLKCLEKEPPKRYPTAQSLAKELGRFLDGQPIQARPVSAVGRTWRWCWRNPQVASLAGVAALALVLGLAGVLWQWRQAEAQRKRAEASELSERQRAYISEMNAAQAALKANNPGRALELLHRHRPPAKSEIRNPKSEIDLRGFEWRYLWQECQNDAEDIIGTLPSRIRSLEVSPDAHWLVAGSERGALKVWSLLDHEEIPILADQSFKSYATFSPDSRLLLYTDQSATSWGIMRTWDTQTRQRRTFLTNAWAVGVPILSPDGQWLGYGAANTNYQAKVVVVDWATRKTIGELNGPSIISDFHGLDWAFAGDGRSVVGSENGPNLRIALSDFTNGSQSQHYFGGHSNAITALAVSPDSRVLATGAGLAGVGRDLRPSGDNAIKVWDLTTFELRCELPGHENWIAALKFSPDGRKLASGSADQTIRLWDVAAKRLDWVSRPLPQAVTRVCFAPDGRTLFSGTSDGVIQRWSLTRQPENRRFSRQTAGLDFLGLSPLGDRFAGIRKGVVLLGEPENTALAKPIPELGTNNLCLLFSADPDVLFAGTWSGEVQVWSLSGRQITRRLQPLAEPVWRLQRDSSGQNLAIEHSDYWSARKGRPCRIDLWDVAGNVTAWREQKSWTVSGYRLASAFSPDGRWLATGDPSGPLQVWNLEGLAPTNVTSVSAGTITELAVSPDGSLLAAANEEGRVQIWAMPMFHEVCAPFRAHKRAVQALTFSHDNRRLATGGDGDEAVKLWTAATGEELITLERPGENVRQLAFSSDGNQLIARNSQGDVLIWHVPSFAEISETERTRRPP
jgi:WD40 repeat protein/predicted Ser/Thr protein kinase